MIIAGVSGNFGRPEHDASAAIVVDDKVVAAAEEERFVQYKSAIGLMPDRAMKFCLDRVGVGMEDVDVLAFPRSTWVGHEERLRWWCRNSFGSTPREIRFVDHHLSHAASSALTSPFSDALCVSLDMTGDGISTAAYEWDRRVGFRHIASYKFPRSLGMAYVAITQFLGFRGTEEEGKVMALAQTGRDNLDLSAWLGLESSGFDVNSEMFHPEVFKRYPEFHTRQLPYYSQAFEESFPFRRLPGGPLLQEHRDLAASLQRWVNEAAAAFVGAHLDRSASRRLCLSGGVATNSVLNGHLARTLPITDMFVPSAPGDAGSALGAALYIANDLTGRIYTSRTSRLGPEPAEERLIAQAELGGFRVRRLSADNAAEEALSRVNDSKVIALVQGRMEFGPRALGGRSLVCHPNDPKSLSALTAIKSRAAYRPFAPSITEASFRQLAPGHPDAHFMSYTIRVDDEGKRLLSNAIAADGTTRAQLLHPTDGLIHTIAAGLNESAAVGAVVNTSLNTDGLPIDLDGRQALGLLASSALAAVFLPTAVVDKGA